MCAPANDNARPYVYVAVPCYGGNVSYLTSLSLLELQAACAIHGGIPIRYHFNANESLVQRARNRLVQGFLKSPCTHLLFVDADLGFRPEWILDMLALRKPLIGVTYPKKGYRWDQWPMAKAGEGGALDPTKMTELAVNLTALEGDVTAVDGAVEVRDVPTGLMLIERDVILQMMAAYPETMYVGDKSDHGEPMYALFDCFISGTEYLSEDYGFCRRYQKMGGKAYIYMGRNLEAVATHWGAHPFQGSWETRLARKAPGA